MLVQEVVVLGSKRPVAGRRANPKRRSEEFEGRRSVLLGESYRSVGLPRRFSGPCDVDLRKQGLGAGGRRGVVNPTSASPLEPLGVTRTHQRDAVREKEHPNQNIENDTASATWKAGDT